MHPDHTPGAPPAHPVGTPKAPRFRVPLPESVDGNRRPARRLMHHANAIVAALGRVPAEVETPLIVDAAALACQVEDLAARAAAGEQVDPNAQVRVSGALARALDRLGIGAGRQPDKPEPDELARLLEQRRAAARGAAA